MIAARRALPASQRPVSPDRVLRAIQLGCEAAPEISEETQISIDRAEAMLENLRAAGALARERKPTFHSGRKDHGGPYFRYRLAEGVNP